MSDSSAPSPVTSPPLLRWLVLAALLSGEVFLLTLRFDPVDADALNGRSEWWAELLRNSHQLLVFILAIAATVFLVGTSLWSEVRQLPVPPLSFRRSGPMFVGHLAALAAFTGVTALLLEGNAAVLPKSAWTVLWLVLGLAVAGSCALIAMPARLWLQLMRRNHRMLLAGLGFGGLAIGAGVLLESCWRPLAGGTMAIARALLSLLYSDIVYQPDEQIVGTSTYAVEIDPCCSGYEGIGLLSVFLATYLWLFRRDFRFPHVLLLWPVGVIAVWLSNAVRIAVLIVLGAEGWPEIADGGFHREAGWLAFNTVALGLVFLATRLRFFAAEPLSATKTPVAPAAAVALPEGPHPTIAYVMPFLAFVATTMITAAFTADFDALYPLRVLAVAAVLWGCRRAYAELRGSWSLPPLVLGTAAFGLWIALVPSDIGQPSPLREGLARLSPAWAAVWLTFRIVGATIAVPLAEELAFRGYLLRRLQSADWCALPLNRPSWTAVLISSVLFGVLHKHWLAGTLAGFVYAAAVSRRGCLLDAVLAHAVTNALLAGYVLATGAYALWS